jgi:hypothetical protein
MKVLFVGNIQEAALDKVVIGMFAQEYLKDHTTVTEYDLQKFIANRPEVQTVLSIDDIRIALDESYSRGELKLIFADGEIGVYKKGK